MAAAMAGVQLPADPYENHGYKLIITTVISFVLATTGIVGRFAARYICHKRLELNDWLITLGFIMKLGLTICSSVLLSYGIGRHIYILDPSKIVNYLKSTWTGSLIYAPGITFIKCSILSLYYVAFPSRYMRVCVWTMVSITVAWCIAICLVGIFSCVPVDKAWHPDKPGGTCINTNAYYWGLQIPNIVTDFIICFMPFKEIYHLHLPRAQLLQIGGVLALGLVTCAIDIVRLVVFVHLPVTMDITWADLAPSMWLDLEMSIAILCACLPVMRPLLRPRQFYWTNRQRATTMTDGEGRYAEVTSSHGKPSKGLAMGSSGGWSTSKGRSSGGSGRSGQSTIDGVVNVDAKHC